MLTALPCEVFYFQHFLLLGHRSLSCIIKLLWNSLEILA